MLPTMRNRLGIMLLSLLALVCATLAAMGAGQNGVQTDTAARSVTTVRPAARLGGADMTGTVENSTPVLDCIGEIEDEPDLVDGYIDTFNGGCNSPDDGFPRQLLAGDTLGGLVFCGRSGWYHSVSGSAAYRDTDWFWTVIGPAGQIEWTLVAEQDVFGFLLSSDDCDNFEIRRTLEAGPDESATTTITGEVGQILWLWVGPRTSHIPDGVQQTQFDYIVGFSGLMPEALPVAAETWGSFKASYR